VGSIPNKASRVTGPAQPESAPSEATVRTKSSMQLVGFRLADQEYAFRIEQIQEIVIPNRVTRMPQVPDYVEGVAHLRGTISQTINL